MARRLLAEAGIEHRVVANDSNAGPYAQWLRGLEMARGELVWIAEADDHCYPTLLQALVPAFADPRVVISYCQSRQIDADDRPIRGDYLNYTRPIHPTRWLQAYRRSGRDEIADTLAIKNTLPNASAVLMRRPDLAPIREMLLSLRNAGDWLVYTHLLERGDIAFCPHALNAHRLHGTSVTHGGGQERHFAEILRVQRRIAERHALAPATLAKIEDARITHRILACTASSTRTTAATRRHRPCWARRRAAKTRPWRPEPPMATACLVIGGGGFIGRRTVSLLLDSGRDVLVLGRSPGRPALLDPRARYRSGDYGDAATINDQPAPMDEVIDLAYATVPKSSFDDPVFDLDQNVRPAVTLLQAAARSTRLRKLVFVSSGGTVYGHALRMPIDESHPTDPVSPYGIT
ncbi:MAG: NAD-dependent epimerase/dehydratase family protein, partial [Betaproteobacteria bacterium]|nr:NAD-dependent epimerase/dehydratase family protein [Betaproteobacteria bacterium]